MEGKNGMERTIAIIVVSFYLFFTYTFAAGDDSKKINLNTATAEQLMTVPGISQTIAEKIIRLRQEYSGFTVIEELLDIDGIDNDMINQLKKYIEVIKVEGCGC